MSLNLYWAACRLDIPATHKSLLRHIALSYNEEHERASYFGLDKLAAHTGLNKTTIIRSTKWLEEMGLLVVDRGGGRGASNLYVPIPKPNNRVKALGERVAERNSFSASEADETAAPCSKSVAMSSESVAPCSETVAPCNPKGSKETKEIERAKATSFGPIKKAEREPDWYEQPEYLASFSAKDAPFVVMCHRHGKEKLAKLYGPENTERIAALIAEVQVQKRFGVETDGDAPTIAATEPGPAPGASEETRAKGEANHIAEAKAVCPVFAPGSNVIPLTVTGYFRRPQTIRLASALTQLSVEKLAA